MGVSFGEMKKCRKLYDFCPEFVVANSVRREGLGENRKKKEEEQQSCLLLYG